MAASGWLEKARMVSRCYGNRGADDDAQNDASDADDTDVGVDEQTADQEASFALEYQLRDFIAHNLHMISIPGRRLRLYVDPSGQNGIEYPSAVGPIDILAVDESGDLVVFELKRTRSPDQAIGQLARYMGWVKLTIAEDRDVHGVVVAGTITENLRYAASVIPNVSLFEYAVQFHLKPANSVKQDQ
jgi:endonuclease